MHESVTWGRLLATNRRYRRGLALQTHEWCVVAISFNEVVLGGNLSRDPKLRFTGDGVPVCSFGLAVNKKRGDRERVDYTSA